jgi:hypothetical protein
VVGVKLIVILRLIIPERNGLQQGKKKVRILFIYLFFAPVLAYINN